MLIDWFTVIAQVVNFLILVWLLRVFLYKPVLKAIRNREAKIAAQLSEAESKKQEALKEQEDFQKMNAEFRSRQDSMLNKAGEEAATHRKRLMEEARKEYDTLRENLQSSLQKEKKKYTEEIAGRSKEEVFALTRKIFTDLADADLEQKITEVFLRRLRDLDSEQVNALKKIFSGSAPPPLHVQSSYPLREEQQKELRVVINKLLGVDVVISFKTEPDKIKGIQLVAGGYKIGWNLEGYLETLEKKVADELDNFTGQK